MHGEQKAYGRPVPGMAYTNTDKTVVEPVPASGGRSESYVQELPA